MCSVRGAIVQCYSFRVRPEQRIIADWMERVRERHGLNWKQWADRVEKKFGQKISGTTLSRAVKDDYESVTSIPTLHMLASAVDEPTVLDYLAGKQQKPALNAETLTVLMATMLPLLPSGGVTERDAPLFGKALVYGLGLIADDPAILANPGALAVVARAAMSQFRDHAPQP